MLHGTGIFAYIWLKSMVGKFSISIPVACGYKLLGTLAGTRRASVYHRYLRFMVKTLVHSGNIITTILGSGKKPSKLTFMESTVKQDPRSLKKKNELESTVTLIENTAMWMNGH